MIYQIYPRSFADANGDGIGDLDGVRAKLPYLADLGVDAIWLSPFYPSPQADAGYDVSDYRDVDPIFGTLDDARALIAEAHDHGLRIIIDLVPNHTSYLHEWFQAALAAATGQRRAGPLPLPRRHGAGRDRCRRTTGSPTSAVPAGPGCRTASGTCTCSPRSSPTWTGPTPR